jgi:RND family efflux transporter MFP subunit
VLKKYFLLIVFTVAIISWLLIMPVGVENSYTQVKAFRAGTTDAVTTVDCSGTIEAAVMDDVTLGCAVKISDNLVKIGDKVKKGDKLLSIDKNVTMQLLAVSGTVSSSQTSSQVSSDDAAGALKQALSLGIIEKSTYNSLLGKITTSGNSSSSSSSSGSKSSLNETATAELLSSVEKCLYAPISGTVTGITDGAEGITPAGTTVAEIVDMNSVRIKAQVDENYIKEVKTGQRVIITGTGFNGKYSGEVKQIYPVAEDESTSSSTGNMVNVIVGIDKPDNTLLPGLSATVKIKVSEQKNAVKLPYDSVGQDDSGNEYVYVFKSGRAVKRYITTGDEDDDGIQVVKGISSGEIIIEDLTDSISDGISVRIK